MTLLPKIHDPGYRSLRRAGRTAVVMSIGFFFGRFALDNQQFAVMATFSGAAVMGIADFTGGRRNRVQATTITLVAGAVLVVLGTAVSQVTLIATAVMFVVAFIIGFGAVFSGYFAAGTSAVIVFFVVATGLPGPLAVIPSRLEGVAFAGVLCLIASAWLWPSRAVSTSQRALADTFRLLAHAVGQLAQGVEVDREAQRNALDGAVLAAELAVAQSAWRPGGLTHAHKARMYLLQEARRLSSLLDHIPTTRLDGASEVGRSERHMLGVMSTTLGHCAEALVSNGSIHPSAAAAESAKVDYDTLAAAAFKDRIRAGAEVGELEHDVAGFFATMELGRATVLAAIHTRVVFGIRPDKATTVPNAVLVSAMTVGVPSLDKWIRRAKGNFNFRSIHLRNSLRLALALAAARLVVGVFDLQHGFWVMFATLVVVRTSASGTRSTAIGAAVGTGIGFLVSTGMVVAFGLHLAVYCVMLPILIFAAFYLPGAVSFVLGQAFFTMVIVVMFNILTPTGWSVGLVRFEDVVIGAAIGLVAGLLLWPKGASTELAGAIADLIDVGNTVATSAMRSLLNGEALVVDASDRWHPAAVAATHAEDVFSQFLSEPHVPPAPVLAWSEMMATAHRIWYGAAIAAGIPVPADCRSQTPILQAEIIDELGVVERDHRRLAETLRRGIPLSVVPLQPLQALSYAKEPESTFRLLQVHAWLGELLLSLEGLDPILRATVLPEPTDAPASGQSHRHQALRKASMGLRPE